MLIPSGSRTLGALIVAGYEGDENTGIRLFDKV